MTNSESVIADGRALGRNRGRGDGATDAGRAALDAMITRQAQIIAYIDDFKLLMIATLVVIPLLSSSRRRPMVAARTTRSSWNEI